LRRVFLVGVILVPFGIVISVLGFIPEVIYIAVKNRKNRKNKMAEVRKNIDALKENKVRKKEEVEVTVVN